MPLDVEAARNASGAMQRETKSAASNIEHLAAKSSDDPDFQVRFIDFEEWTNVMELAMMDLKIKKQPHNDPKLIAERALMLYIQFYKDPQRRNDFPLNAIIWKMPTTQTAEEIDPRPAIAAKRPKLSVSINIGDEPHWPVTFDEFERFTNVRDLAVKRVYRKKKELSEANIMKAARKFYMIFFTIPEYRCMKPLADLAIKDGCPAELIERIHSHCRDETVSVRPTTSALAEAEDPFDKSMFDERTTAANDDFDFPVTLAEFKEISKWRDVVDKIIMQRPLNGDGCREADDALRERVLVNYYHAFYTQPSIRGKYPLQLKPCPGLVKAKMLRQAEPKGAASETVEQPQTPPEEDANVAQNNPRRSIPTVVDLTEDAIAWKPVDLAQSEAWRQAIPFNIDMDFEIEKYLPVTFQEFDTNTTVREIAAKELQRKLVQHSESAVMLLARKLYHLFYMYAESRPLVPLSRLRTRSHCPPSLRPLIPMEHCANEPMTEPAATTAQGRHTIVEQGTNTMNEDQIDEGIECMTDQVFIDKPRALSTPFLLMYIEANLPNGPDHHETLRRIKQQVLPEAPSTSATASNDGGSKAMLLAADDWEEDLQTDDSESEEPQFEEKVDGDAWANSISFQPIEAIKQNKDLDRIIGTDLANVYLQSTMLRSCNGRKLRILRAVLDMSSQEFLKYCRLHVSYEQIMHNSSDVRCLLRCKQMIMSEPHVWPKNLYVPLAGLVDYLSKRGVTLLRPDLEHITPRLLHWADIATCTDFDRCVRFDYSRRNGGLKPPIASGDVQLLRQNYLHRCCELDEWIWHVPRITDDILDARVRDAQEVEAANMRRRQSAEPSPLPDDVMGEHGTVGEEEAALEADEQQSLDLSVSEEEHFMEEVHFWNTEMLNEIEDDDYDQLEQPTYSNNCVTAQVADEAIDAANESLHSVDELVDYDSIPLNFAELVHRVEMLPPQHLSQGDNESSESPGNSSANLDDHDSNDCLVWVKSSHQLNAAVNHDCYPLQYTDQVTANEGVAIEKETPMEIGYSMTDFDALDSSSIEEVAQTAANVDLASIDDSAPVDSDFGVIDPVPLTASVESTQMPHAADATDQTSELETFNTPKRIKLERRPLNNCRFVLDDATDEFICSSIHESEQVVVIDDDANSMDTNSLGASPSPMSVESNYTPNRDLGQRLSSCLDEERSEAIMSTPSTTNPPPSTVTGLTSSRSTLINILYKAKDWACGVTTTVIADAALRRKNAKRTSGAADCIEAPQAPCSSSTATAGDDVASNSLRSDSNNSVSRLSVLRTLASGTMLFNSTFLVQTINPQQPPADTNSNSNASSRAASTSNVAPVNIETILCRRVMSFNYFEKLTPADISRHELRTNAIGGRYMQALIRYAGRHAFVYANDIDALLPHLSPAELNDVQFVLCDLHEFEYNVNASNTIDAECDLRKRVLFQLFDTAPMFAHCRVIFDSDMRDFGRIERVKPDTDVTVQRRPRCALKAAVKPEILAEIAALKAKMVH